MQIGNCAATVIRSFYASDKSDTAVTSLSSKSQTSEFSPSLARAEGIFMAVAAETARLIPELAGDEEIRRRAAEFIGAVALSGHVEAPTDVSPIESLHEAIQLAAKGNEQARAMVETNVRTDVIERTMKAGHVMSVDLMPDEAGKIRQHGQSLDSIQANSLRFAASNPQMRERIEAETRNAFRIQHHFEQGSLEDNYFVVFSRAADNMSKAAMKRAGFFVDTMSCAIQVTSLKNGRLVTESAFVAGVESPGEVRHDNRTIPAAAREVGIDYSGMNATETLDAPVLVPKSMMPDGVINLVELVDNVRGTFFGQAKPQQDYSSFLEACREREQRFEPKVQKIVDRLVKRRGLITSPVEAVKRLHEISGEEMLEQAVGDADIDPAVFGPISAHALMEARLAYNHGDAEGVIKNVQIAKANRRDSSCPGASLGGNEGNENGRTSTSDETCEFVSKKCPKCGARNVKTTVTKTRITGYCGCSKSK